jgi:hypothetical protein
MNVPGRQHRKTRGSKRSSRRAYDKFTVHHGNPIVLGAVVVDHAVKCFLSRLP